MKLLVTGGCGFTQPLTQQNVFIENLLSDRNANNWEKY